MGIDAVDSKMLYFVSQTMPQIIPFVVGGIFGPTILMYYAKNEMEKLVTYSQRAVKFVGLAVALPVGLVCGFASPLLNVWLGPDFVSLAPLMMLLTFHLCFNLGYLPLHSVSMAANQVKVPALVQIAIGVLNLILAIFLAKFCHMNLYGIALAGAIVLTLKNILFTPLYSAYILKKPLFTFIRELFPISAAAAGIILLSWTISLFIPLISWTYLIGAGTCVTMITCSAAWFFLITSDERRFLKKLIFSLSGNSKQDLE